jgi:hypothetical protein
MHLGDVGIAELAPHQIVEDVRVGRRDELAVNFGRPDDGVDSDGASPGLVLG